MIRGTNLHIYQTTFENESRMLKETRSLVENGVVDDCVILGLWKEGLPEEEEIGPGRKVMRVRTLAHALGESVPAKAIRFAEWYLRIALYWGRRDVGMVNSHSLVTLPLGVALKLFKRSRLIYDTHELETEAAGVTGMRQWLARRIERALIGSVDDIIVVSGSIADWYRSTYDLAPGRVHLVRNVPEYDPDEVREKSSVLRDACGLGPDDLLFLYQGLIDEGRGVDLLLDVFSRPGPNQHVVFMGYGKWEGRVRERADRAANIHFYPAVAPGEVLRHTRSADVGLAIIEPNSLSYEYCLPNKLFEYVVCGLPVVASNLVEMRRFIEQHGCGWLTEPTIDAVRESILGIDANELAQKRQNASAVPRDLNWSSEERHLLKVYADA